MKSNFIRSDNVINFNGSSENYAEWDKKFTIINVNFDNWLVVVFVSQNNFMIEIYSINIESKSLIYVIIQRRVFEYFYFLCFLCIFVFKTFDLNVKIKLLNIIYINSHCKFIYHNILSLFYLL